MAVTTAIIYVPANQRLDSTYADECQTYAADTDLCTVILRDVTVVDHVLATGWADIVVVARPHHAMFGWPVRVVSDIRERDGATVVPLPACGGVHRAVSESLAGRVMRHPTGEVPLRRRPSAEQLIEDYRRRHGFC
jgi:hypothetical protein